MSRDLVATRSVLGCLCMRLTFFFWQVEVYSNQHFFPVLLSWVFVRGRVYLNCLSPNGGVQGGPRISIFEIRKCTKNLVMGD